METQGLFVSVAEVARVIGRSKERTYALLAPNGPIPCVRLGKQVRIPRPAFEQWLASLTEQALANVRQEWR